MIFVLKKMLPLQFGFFIPLFWGMVKLDDVL